MQTKFTSVIVGITGLAVAYVFFTTVRETDIASKLGMLSVLVLLPWAVIGAATYLARTSTAIVVAWCVVLISMFTIRVEWGCKGGSDCGWMLAICMIVTWLGSAVSLFNLARGGD